MSDDEEGILARAKAAAAARLAPLTEQAETGGRQITHQNLSI